jgi:hypothetical protein
LDHATASLLPIREAIDVCIGELLHLRPHQAPSKPDKIVKILTQLAAEHILPSDQELLQARYSELHDKLSGAKNMTVVRDEENTLMVEATIFLIELLSAIDPAKLKTFNLGT